MWKEDRVNRVCGNRSVRVRRCGQGQHHLSYSVNFNAAGSASATGDALSVTNYPGWTYSEYNDNSSSATAGGGLLTLDNSAAEHQPCFRFGLGNLRTIGLRCIGQSADRLHGNERHG